MRRAIKTLRKVKSSPNPPQDRPTKCGVIDRSAYPHPDIPPEIPVNGLGLSSSPFSICCSLSMS